MKTKGKLMIICVFICLASLNLVSFGVKAQSAGAIVINADGSVSGTSLIQRQGNIYSLTGNIYDSPITVLCSNIVFDGEGFALQGAGGWGTPGVGGAENTAAIDLTCSNVTVRDFYISGWETGVAGAYDGNTVLDNNISRTEDAVAIYGNSYVVCGNFLSNSIYGVYIKGSGALVAQNQIADNYGGIVIFPTLKTTVTENNFTGNRICLTIGTYYDFSYLIYDNNFIINSDTTIVSTNSDQLGPVDQAPLPQWDNGSVGNYWSNYAAKYPSTAPVGNSSIGDTPYLIRTNPTAVDRYPLMTPVAITNSADTSTTSNPIAAASKASSNPRGIVVESAIIAAIVAAVTACVVLVLRNKLFWLQKNSKSA